MADLDVMGMEPTSIVKVGDSLLTISAPGMDDESQLLKMLKREKRQEFLEVKALLDSLNRDDIAREAVKVRRLREEVSLLETKDQLEGSLPGKDQEKADQNGRDLEALQEDLDLSEAWLDQLRSERTYLLERAFDKFINPEIQWYGDEYIRFLMSPSAIAEVFWRSVRRHHPEITRDKADRIMALTNVKNRFVDAFFELGAAEDEAKENLKK